MIEKMRLHLNKIVNVGINNSKSTILIMLLILGGIFTGFKGFEVLLTIDKLINKDYESSKSFFELRDEFERGTGNFVIFQKTKSGELNEIELCQIRSWKSTVLAKSDHIINSHSVFSLRKPTWIKEEDNKLPRLLFLPVVPLECDVAGKNKFPLKEIGQTPWAKLLSNSTFSDVAIDYHLSEMGEKNFESKMIPKLIAEQMEEWTNQMSKDIKVHWLGNASYMYWMSKGLKHNNLLNVFILIIIILAFRLFFGTWVSSFIFIFTLIYSALAMYGLMSLTKTPIDILNSSLFLLLTVSSLGDFVFLSHHQLYNLRSDEDWRTSFYSLALPSLFTSLTTFIGFISLYASDLDIIRRLGLWAGLSGIIEWITTFVFLPAILNLFFKRRTWINPGKVCSPGLNILSKIKVPKIVSVLLLLLYFVVPYAKNNFHVSDVPSELFLKDSPFRQSMDYLFNTRGFKGDVSLIFHNPGNEELNRELITKMKKHPLVTRIEDPWTMVQWLKEGLPEHSQRNVELSLERSSSYKRLVTENKKRALVYLTNTDLKEINTMRKFVQYELCPLGECSLAGSLVAYSDFSQQVPYTLISSLFWSLGLVLFVIISLRLMTGTNNFFQLLVSTFWGVAAIIVTMALFHVRLNFVTCVVVAILVGMTGDNAIHFLLGGEDIKSGIAKRAGASVMTTFIMAICSLVFLFYYFEPPRVFGILLLLGFFYSLVGDLWILRGLTNQKN